MIRQSMRRKHPAFFSDKETRAQEQREFPRYVIYLADENRTVYGAATPTTFPLRLRISPRTSGLR